LVKKSDVFEVHKPFKASGQSVENIERFGRPKKHRSDENVAKKMQKPLRPKRCLCVRQLARKLNAQKEKVRKFLREDLFMKQVSA
jgi:hypothetical protein